MATKYPYNLNLLQQLIILMVGVYLLMIFRRYIISMTNIQSIQVLIIFILIILNILKFYFVIWSVLQKLIGYSSEIKLSAIQIITIYIAIMVNCLFLIMLGVVEHIFLWYVFEYIIFLDTVKFFAIIYQNKLNWNIQCKWTMNNLVSIILLIIINILQLSLGENASVRYENLFFGISTTICLLNTIIGFILSRYRFSSG